MARTFSEYKQVSSALRQDVRVVCALLCAERTIHIFEQFGDGDEYPQIGTLIQGAGIAIRNDSQVEVDPDTLELVTELIGAYNADSIGILASSVTVTLRFIETLTDDGPLSLARALTSTIDTGMHADRLLERHGRPRRAKDDELAWVEALLESAVRASSASDLWRMYASVVQSWWPAYESLPEHV